MMITLPALSPRPCSGTRATCRHTLSCCNGTAGRLAMKASQSFHVEVLVGEDEPPESALKRFRWASKTIGLVQEARRRRYFENSQEEKKRRVKEGHMKKSKRYVPPPRYEEAVTTLEPPPFADLFGEPEDIFSDGKFSAEGPSVGPSNGQPRKRF